MDTSGSADFLKQKYREIIESLTEDQVNEFKDAFAQFDVDNSGAITGDELGPAMRALGHNPTEQEINDMIGLVDVDKSNTIDFQEFLVLMGLRLSQPFAKEEVMEAFEVLDKDGTGYITVADLRKAMQEILPHPMTDEDFSEMANDARPDEEGRIDYKEFVRFMFGV